MNKSALLLLLSISPLMASAATPWIKWENVYIRAENDGNVACARKGDTRECDWNPTAAPGKDTRSLACGPTLIPEWGITGYETANHWCNRAFADNYAKWKVGSYWGFNGYLAEGPAGNLMCDSADGVTCRTVSDPKAPRPSKPVVPIVCGPIAEGIWGKGAKEPDHWCQQGRVTVAELDFTDPKWAKEVFSYHKGWAGQGFGLTGTQRGAPELLRIWPEEGLGLISRNRDAQWLARYTKGVYGKPDTELQDDLFMYSDYWIAADEPAVVMHIYRPKGASVSLRMPAVINNDDGKNATYWPGIYVHETGITMRTVHGDFNRSYAGSENNAVHWWTLGLKVTKNGDMEYYAAPDWRASPFEPSLLRGTQNSLIGSTPHKIISRADAVVMISLVLPNEAEALIGDIRYAKNTKAQKKNP